MAENTILIVGAGYSGAVLARELAEKGNIRSIVIDARDHLAGNCHTARGAEGIMEHSYGPHIFNTNHADVVAYIHKWGEWVPYFHQVKAVNRRGVFSFPINLHTINQFFGKSFSPLEAERYISKLARLSNLCDREDNLETHVISLIGRELYEAFFHHYTVKQWGVEPAELPSSIVKRLPIRFDYNDSYYESKYVFLPKRGYTTVIEKLFDHPNIEVSLRTAFSSEMSKGFSHVFFTGPIDSYFDFRFGALSYRSVVFERRVEEGDVLGSPVINYTDDSCPFTREHEHKHLAPWESHRVSAVYREFARDSNPGEMPFYPRRLDRDMETLSKYIDVAKALPNVTFLGRLGTYRYLDMDQVIGGTLDVAEAYLRAHRKAERPPAFGEGRHKLAA